MESPDKTQLPSISEDRVLGYRDVTPGVDLSLDALEGLGVKKGWVAQALDLSGSSHLKKMRRSRPRPLLLRAVIGLALHELDAEGLEATKLAQHLYALLLLAREIPPSMSDLSPARRRELSRRKRELERRAPCLDELEGLRSHRLGRILPDLTPLERLAAQLPKKSKAGVKLRKWTGRSWTGSPPALWRYKRFVQHADVALRAVRESRCPIAALEMAKAHLAMVPGSWARYEKKSQPRGWRDEPRALRVVLPRSKVQVDEALAELEARFLRPTPGLEREVTLTIAAHRGSLREIRESLRRKPARRTTGRTVRKVVSGDGDE